MDRSLHFNHLARICVVGVGGGGGSAINRMIKDGVRGVDYIAVNTDTIALLTSEAPTRIQIGEAGTGAGGNMALAQYAAQHAKAELQEALQGADMVFVTAGMGGGTGSGASPIIARLAREQGALTIGVVTHPFKFEGGQRLNNAKRGIRLLEESVDTLIAIPNDNLLDVAQEKSSLHEAFRTADGILEHAIQGITEIVTKAGMVNLDLADVRAVMSEGGTSIMGVGTGQGADGAVGAALEAVNSPLLGISVDGAKGMLFNVRAHSDLGIQAVNKSAEIARERAHPDCNFIFGYTPDDSLGDEVRVTVVATGVDPLTPSKRVEVRVSDIIEEVTPTPEPIPTRRVYMSRPKKRRNPAYAGGVQTRFSTKQWGIPNYLRQ
ncbi:MAG: cell division protein FtsZ [Candidatus Promineifilaceae bacterium]